jgi:hypothetical protein
MLSSMESMSAGSADCPAVGTATCGWTGSPGCVCSRVAPPPAWPDSDLKGSSMNETPSDPHPLSDLEYDWITLIQNKAQALMAYDQYIKDAERAGSPECAAFFRKVHDTDKAQLAEAKKHLSAVMQGKMGGGQGGRH